MKTTCLKLASFILLGITLLSLFSQKVLAKSQYGTTWTVQATPSAVIVAPNNVYYAGYLASSSSGLASVEMNPYYALDTSHQVSDPLIASTGALFLSKLNSDLTYNKSFIIEADKPYIINNQNASISLTKIATDSASNVYLLGSFHGNVDFNPTGGMDFHSSNGETWPFLLKMNADGTYGGTYFWENNNITLRDIIIDKSDNIYLLGQVTNTTLGDITINLDPFPLAGSAIKTLHSNDKMGFYTRLKTGAPYTYDYSRTFKNTGTGSQHFEMDHIASTSAGNIFLYGVFNGTVNFNGSGGTDNKTSNNTSDDLYLSEYNASGTYMNTYVIGGVNNESAGALAVDNNDNIYYSGGFNNMVNFNPINPLISPDNHTATLPGQRFLSKLNSNESYGYTLIWNSNTLAINKISFDNANLMYLIGTSTGNTNYDPITGSDNTQLIFEGNDAFVTVINPDNTYNYTYVWGGINDEKAMDLSFDANNNFYIAGSTKSLSINFDPTGKYTIPTTFPNGDENGYVTEFSAQQVVAPSPSPTPTPDASGNNSNSSSNFSGSSGPQSFTCTNHAPVAPKIFQIWATKNAATIYFVPSADQQDYYTISYGPYSDAGTYNVTFNYSGKSGAIPYTINALATNTAYYFKVRANNGCMGGEWSNTLNLKTAYSASGK